MYITGIEGDLFYVRNGTVNDYALSFNLLIRPEHDNIYFTWQNLRSSTHFPVSAAPRNMSVRPSVRLYTRVSICLGLPLTACLCVRLCVCACSYMSVCQSVCVCVCVCVCVYSLSHFYPFAVCLTPCSNSHPKSQILMVINF